MVNTRYRDGTVRAGYGSIVWCTSGYRTIRVEY